MALTKISRSLLDTGVSDSSDATAITIDSSENVGIGETSPDLKLHIKSSGQIAKLETTASTGDCILTFADAAANKAFVGFGSSSSELFQISNIENGDMKFDTNNTERMRIDSSGNVGIGTNSMTQKLAVNGNIQLLGTGTDNDSYSLLFQNGACAIARDNNDLDLHAYNAMIFGASNTSYPSSTERMRIDNTGALLVGTTSQIVSSTEECVHIKNGDGAGQLFLDNTRSSGSQFMVQIYRLGTRVGSIQTTTTVTSYLTTSDYRTKENVDYDFNALERVSQLKPARFNFIAEPDVTIDGFLAHEVSSVVPQAVSGEKDAIDKEGNPDLQGIDHSKLVPLLTKAIQELSAKVEELESKINE